MPYPYSSYYKPQTSILSNQFNQQGKSRTPLQYFKQKNYFLEQTAQKISVQSSLQQIDLKRNFRIDYYMKRYLRGKEQLQQEKLKAANKLSSSEFQPILDPTLFSFKQNENKAKAILKDQLYKKYVSQYNQCKLQIKEEQNQQSKNNQDYVFLEGKPEKEVQLIDLQIWKLHLENKQAQIEKGKSEKCRNSHLISKLSGSIISGYMVYFDQIYKLLEDEILQDEVIYFNQLEAELRRAETLGPPLIRNTQVASQNNKKALQMVELVKQLDQLWDACS